MKQHDRTVPRELDRREMMEVVGGEDSGGSIAHDLGVWLGYTVGAVQRWFESMPAADYAYCKVGYSS